MLFVCTFLFLFGWKITEQADLILMLSAMLTFWVLLLSPRAAFTRSETLFLWILAAITIYSGVVVVLHGSADAQVVLRSARALLNATGGLALFRLYTERFGNGATDRVVSHLFLAIVLHGALICALPFLPAIRAQVYAMAHTLDYVNNTATIMLGLRSPGLTYGLATTSIVQLGGLLLLPAVAKTWGPGLWRRAALAVAALILVGSLFFTGRTGLLLAAVLLPLLLLIRAFMPPARPLVVLGGTLAVIAVAVVAVLALYAARSLLPTAVRFALEHSTEVLDVFLRGGETMTTRAVSGMYFVPDSPFHLLFGSSNLGRGELAYVASDVGYIKLIFAVGLVGLVLTLLPYALFGLLALQALRRRSHELVALALLFSVVATLILNGKELALLTRNQWSIQVMLAAVWLAAASVPRRNGAAAAGREERSPAS